VWVVTGVAGFIDSNLLQELIALGQTVVGVDNFSTGHRANLDEVVTSPLPSTARFRMIEGEVARSVAAYSGPNVYLDVALSWVVGFAERCPVILREERGRRSGYTPRRLVKHFWQLVLSSGTLPLRLIAFVGFASIVFAVAYSALQVWNRLHNEIPVQGWTSTMIVICLFAGLTLVSIGIIAEYLGFSVSMAMGKPAYLIVSRPREDLAKKS